MRMFTLFCGKICSPLRMYNIVNHLLTKHYAVCLLIANCTNEFLKAHKAISGQVMGEN